MFKKVLLSIISLGLLIGSTFAYTLNSTDKILVQKLTQKVEDVIESKGESFRGKFVSILNKYAIKYKSEKPRYAEIFLGVARNLENKDIEKEFENILSSENSNNYFRLPKTNLWGNEIYIFDKSNLSSPYKTTVLPEKTNITEYTFFGNQYDEGVFFNEDGDSYVLGYLSDGGAVGDVSRFIFKISKDGSITKLHSIGRTSEGIDNTKIDNEDKKIAYSKYINQKYHIFVHDINTNNTKEITYESSSQNIEISSILAFNKSNLTLLIDLVGIDAASKDAEVVVINTNNNQVISKYPYYERKENIDNKPIQYDGGCREECDVFINGKKVKNEYIGINFTNVIGNNVIGWYGGGDERSDRITNNKPLFEFFNIDDITE